MQAPDSHAARPATRRRWFQFSLRTLLVLTAILALLCSWLAVKAERARRERDAVRAIRQLGGTIRYEYQRNNTGDYLWKDTEVAGHRPWFSRYARIVGDDFASSAIFVSFNHSGLTDEDLARLRPHLEALSHLRELYLDRTSITDRGLEHLQGMTQQRLLLSVHGCPVTPAGVERLRAKLPGWYVADGPRQ